jgi:hypothetical protein
MTPPQSGRIAGAKSGYLGPVTQALGSLSSEGGADPPLSLKWVIC